MEPITARACVQCGAIALNHESDDCPHCSAELEPGKRTLQPGIYLLGSCLMQRKKIILESHPASLAVFDEADMRHWPQWLSKLSVSETDRRRILDGQIAMSSLEPNTDDSEAWQAYASQLHSALAAMQSLDDLGAEANEAAAHVAEQIQRKYEKARTRLTALKGVVKGHG